ncbi:MAG: hypothetical protein ACI4DN_05390 [Lachnospiraceae bacterium]
MINVNKGELSYLAVNKRKEILKTILFFSLSAAIFWIGCFSTGSERNLLTIVAVLGCLPASKSAVSMIMNLRIKGCSEEDADSIQKRFGENFGYYNLYFTSYQKNYEIHHLVVEDLSIIAYSADEKTEASGFEEHIRTMLKKEGISNMNVKLYREREKYISRVEQLLKSEHETGKENRVVSLLFSISL